MLVFGVDIPLVEIILILSVVVIVILTESIILLLLILKKLSTTKKLSGLTENLSHNILALKKAEIEELDKLRVKKR